ncbi:MAG: hypothetical protein M3Z67_08570 [Commensalibacter sp.]|nr:hypothetical protein [Commensalibacter sp.]
MEYRGCGSQFAGHPQSVTGFQEQCRPITRCFSKKRRGVSQGRYPSLLNLSSPFYQIAYLGEPQNSEKIVR